jgi:hypothetical protein
MATVKIYLKGGQTIVLKDSKIVSGREILAGVKFKIELPVGGMIGIDHPDGVLLKIFDRREIVAVTSEDDWLG